MYILRPPSRPAESDGGRRLDACEVGALASSSRATELCARSPSRYAVARAWRARAEGRRSISCRRAGGWPRRAACIRRRSGGPTASPPFGAARAHWRTSRDLERLERGWRSLVRCSSCTRRAVTSTRESSVPTKRWYCSTERLSDLPIAVTCPPRVATREWSSWPIARSSRRSAEGVLLPDGTHGAQHGIQGAGGGEHDFARERVLVEAGVVGERGGQDRLARDETDDHLGRTREGGPVRLAEALDVSSQGSGVSREELRALDLRDGVAVRLEEVRHRGLASTTTWPRPAG